MRRNCTLLLFSAYALAAPSPPRRITLREAREYALQNHPALQSSQSLEQAATQVTRQVRSRYYPTVYGSVTAAGAVDEGSRVLAGALNNPSIYDRFGMGVTAVQLISDFGRTRSLTQSAQLHAQASGEAVNLTKAQILLDVDRTYYATLRAQAVLKVASQTVDARKLVADQTAALAASKLKSELDVTFARTNLEEARLLFASAENDARSAQAELAAALGLSTSQEFDLVEDPLPGETPFDAGPLVEEALKERPEVKQARLEVQAAERFAKAERALSLPTFSAVGTAGGAPVHTDLVQGTWAAAGVNLDIPVFNGGLFSARRAEAEARLHAAQAQARDLENRVSRDVRLAWLNAINAWKRLQLTASLLAQAAESMKLAQARYDLGLGNIVELSTAQLNVTRAQIAQVSAKFDYQSQKALLDYQTGTLQ
jgi:outer membrane protein